MNLQNFTIPLICDNSVTIPNIWFFRRNFYKGFEVLQFSMSATTTQLLSRGEFCKLRYDINLLKLHLQTFLFIPITQKCQILSLRSDTCTYLTENYVCIYHDCGFISILFINSP